MSDPKRTHQAAQVQAWLKENAPIIAERYRELREQGMSEAEALAIVRDDEGRWFGRFLDSVYGEKPTVSIDRILDIVEGALDDEGP